jgi:hypothetical protein
MKVTILMVVLWSMFAGHSYGEEVDRAPKSPEESQTTDSILRSLDPVTKGRLLSLMNGQERLLERTPTSLFIEQEGQLQVFDMYRSPGKVTRSPAIVPQSIEDAGVSAR